MSKVCRRESKRKLKINGESTEKAIINKTIVIKVREIDFSF